MLKDLLMKNRSYRRFDARHTIGRPVLLELIEHARLCASAANLQPLKYFFSCEPADNANVFKCLKWAGYLRPQWTGPTESEQPTAYIVICGDTAIASNVDCDHGIVSQTILLAAVEQGLGGCIIGSIDRETLRNDLALPLQYEILLVIALGKPAETCVVEECTEINCIKYWRDDKSVHHVPKRSLTEMVIN